MSNICYLSGCDYNNPDNTCMYENPTCLLRDKLANEQAYKQGIIDGIEEYTTKLKSRLLDAITKEHLESITNLINDVAEMVKEK